jgi:hypothetical protein
MIRQQRLTRAQRDRELNKMAGWMPAGTQPDAQIARRFSTTFPEASARAALDHQGAAIPHRLACT